MTGTSISRGCAVLACGLAATSVNCGSHPADPPPPPLSSCLPVLPCAEGASSPAECQLSTQVVSTADRGASGIALDDRYVYLKSRLGVFFAPKAGGSLAPFDGVAPEFPRADSVTDGEYEYRREGDALVRVSAAGTSFVVRPSEDLDDECFAITLRRGALYWTGAAGVLMGVPVQAGAPSVLDRAGGSDCDDDYEGLAVAADDTGIYWIAGDPGERTSDEKPLTLYRTCGSNIPTNED